MRVKEKQTGKASNHLICDCCAAFVPKGQRCVTVVYEYNHKLDFDYKGEGETWATELPSIRFETLCETCGEKVR